MTDFCKKHRDCKHFVQTAYLMYIDSYICDLDNKEYFGEEVSCKCNKGLKPFEYGYLQIDDYVPFGTKAKVYKFPKIENSTPSK